MQYRQITKGMRVSRPGLTTLESYRPIDDKTHEFTDSDEHPTLIELDDTCDVNIPMLLATGAIAEYTPATVYPAEYKPATESRSEFVPPKPTDPKLKDLLDG